MNRRQPRGQETRFLILAGILLLAAFFRLHRLPCLPWGLSQDEVVNADISLSVLAGERAPFLAGGFGHEPLFHFLQAVTLTLFGDNVVGIRMPAVMVGMMLIAASYTLMRQTFGPVAALTTAAGLAVSWWPVIFSRIGVRATTFPLLLTLAMSLLWRGLTFRQAQTTALRRWALVLSSGLLFGLAVYTYTSARILPALASAWLIYAAISQRTGLRHHWRALAGMALVAAVIAAPLLLYLHTRPELEERVSQLGGPLEALRRGDLAPLWQGIRATLGMFSFDGEARWTYGIPGRPIFEPLSGGLFYLGLILCLVHASRPACGLVLPWLFVALVPSMLTPDAPSTIRSIGALPVAYGMIGVAVAWLWKHAARRGRPAQAALAIGLSLLALGNAAWTYRDGFGAWATHPETYWLYKSHFADIAAFLDRQATPQPMVVFEAWVDPVDVNGVRRDLIHDDRQPRWAQAGRSFLWPADAERFTLAMPIYSAAYPDVWRIFAGDPPVTSMSPYRMPDGRPGVTFYAVETEPNLSNFLRQASIAPATLPESTQPVLLPADFGGQVALLGYQVLNNPSPWEGEGLGVRALSAWRVLRDGPEPINVFVHLLDQDGNLAAQYDGFDVWAALLKRGDIVAQLHPLSPDAGIPPGHYHLQIGTYTRADQVRLPVLVEGSVVADRLWLDMVEVKP